MRGPPPPPPFFHAYSPPPPRGPIYFPEGLPLSPLSLLSRRRSCAPYAPDRSSCRVHAEIRSRGTFFERTRIFPPPCVATLIHLHIFNKVVRFPSRRVSLERERNSCGCVLSNRDRRCAAPFTCGGVRGFHTGHVYHVGRNGGSTCCRSCRVGLGEQARR